MTQSNYYFYNINKSQRYIQFQYGHYQNSKANFSVEKNYIYKTTEIRQVGEEIINKNNKGDRITLSDFKLYYKDILFN